MVHSDVCGPMYVRSFSGVLNFVSFIEEYSGYIHIVPISWKIQVLEEFKYCKPGWGGYLTIEWRDSSVMEEVNSWSCGPKFGS